MTATPTRLRTDHLDEAVGLMNTSPRLSWLLPAGVTTQLAYRIRTDNGWDTGWVPSEQSVRVPYGGPALRSHEVVTWTVQVRTADGDSDPSAPATFEMGKLDQDDWQARWVEPVPMPMGAKGHRAAAFLRREFTVERPVVSARLYATAHGLYEAFLNGARVGDHELTPGFTDYVSRLQVQTFDVTDAIVVGANALGVVLSDGWYRGQIGTERYDGHWGERTALLAQLRLVHDDGSVTDVATGDGWRSGLGHIVAADLIEGESWDLTRYPAGWDSPGFDDAAWHPALPTDEGFDRLVDSPSPPVRRVEEITPVAVTRRPDGSQLVDLGQNINGWVRLTRLGPAGTSLTLTHAEWLRPDGDIDVEHARPIAADGEYLPQGQVDHVRATGAPGEVFEPRHTTHGFQYVRIDGHPEALTPDDVRGVVVHTDMRRTGWFSSSDARIDAFHDAATWSFRDNACDLPTDCPQRERAGWTGDWGAFVPTAAFLYDVAGFSVKWLRDVAADQWPDGTIAAFSPASDLDGPAGPGAVMNGSAGWGDAAVIVPWELYQQYGDADILAEMWPTMVRWLERSERMARDNRHPDRAARNGAPLPHERYLWDTGFHWGEWHAAGQDSVPPWDELVASDKGDVATAYLAYSAHLMSKIATVLGRHADARRYAGLAANVRAAWQTEYVDPSGAVTPATQANHVRALAFDLVDDDLKPAVADGLVRLIKDAYMHIGTGFLASPYLLPMLADHGYTDIAYALLQQDSAPGWLVMTDRGANTIWESWNGVGEDGVAVASLNHYSKGAVITFLHRYVAGIRATDVGYRTFRVEPVPGGGLTHAQAAHESPYGRIESRWRVDAGTFHLDVLVPPGTRAEVVLPGEPGVQVGPGRHAFGCPFTALGTGGVAC